MAVKKFIIRLITYGFIILLMLEVIVRILHLHNDTPYRMIDSYGVEKWVPNQSGYSVTGNRRQNVGVYRINASGFNSFREFDPSDIQPEIALIGDSFIEGFHQDFNHSIGKKIEEQIPGVEVYEYGYAGYDLADQLNLIQAYESVFRRIDRIYIYLKYPDDLKRDSYEVSQERMRLEQGLNRLLRNSKLLVYCQNIGILSAITKPFTNLQTALNRKYQQQSVVLNGIKNGELEYVENFQKLWADFSGEKQKITFFLDSRYFPKPFLNHFKVNGLPYLNYRLSFNSATQPVTLIYDQHWNDHGRSIIAKLIAEDYSEGISK